jgi:RsiW-degrading membrane proteinase PrsW (M82 family)
LSLYRNQQLITPPREEEEVYPYHKAWRSLMVESLLFVGITVALFVAFNLLQVTLPDTVNLPANLLLLFVPPILWLLVSAIPERHVPAPRPRLITTFVIAALVANAVAVPVIDHVIQPDQWLPAQPLPTRIIGYTCTIGILHELLKFLILRYVAWPQHYRVRSDAVAYSVATAIGYSLVLNLQILMQDPTIQTGAFVSRVFTNVILQIAGSIIVGYGFSETRFNNAFPLLLPLTLIFSALVTGVMIPLRTNFINRPLGITPAASRDIFGLILGITAYFAILAVVYFLFTVAEKTQDIKLGTTR